MRYFIQFVQSVCILWNIPSMRRKQPAMALNFSSKSQNHSSLRILTTISRQSARATIVLFRSAGVSNCARSARESISFFFFCCDRNQKIAFISWKLCRCREQT